MTSTDQHHADSALPATPPVAPPWSPPPGGGASPPSPVGAVFPQPGGVALPTTGPVRRRTGPARLFLGDRQDPRWARPCLWVLLMATSVLYLWDLTASGYANDFYAASVKSSTESLKAWLFASLDSGNAITVDKPPASIWVMGLSGRLFGFSSFSMLMPQALMGVGSVALLFAAVRRWSGPAAGLVAGAVLALTPVAAVMFRFNNPDALLVLLMTAGAYFVIRAIEDSPNRRGRSTAARWLVLAGTVIGFAFLTKMLQGLLVLPGLGLAYLIAAPVGLWVRIRRLLLAMLAVVVSGGWFVALVAWWPAASRPYIGGSTDNSLWQLAIGYNGLGRIFGQSRGGGTGTPPGLPAGGGGTFAGGPGGGPGGGGFGGATGITRMFSSSFGTEISWLLPAALIGLVAGLWFTRRLRRTDRIRGSLVIWGGWLAVTALVFSYMSGTIHPYYTVALAPAIAALIAISGRELWRGRRSHLARASLALMIAASAWWSFHLLGRDAALWLPWLRWVVLVGGLAGAAALAVSAGRARRLAVAGLVVGSLTAVSGVAAFTVATAATPHQGSLPAAGPAQVASRAGGFGPRGGGAAPSGAFPGGAFPDGAFPGGAFPSGAAGGAGFGGGGPGANASADSQLVDLLNATTTRWAAAVTGSQQAAPLILGTHTAVMAIGGFGGSDPSPTLAQFQTYVAQGQINYFISAGGGFGGFGGRGGAGSAISTWVEQHYTAKTVGSSTVYDLTAPPSA